MKQAILCGHLQYRRSGLDDPWGPFYSFVPNLTANAIFFFFFFFFFSLELFFLNNLRGALWRQWRRRRFVCHPAGKRGHPDVPLKAFTPVWRLQTRCCDFSLCPDSPQRGVHLPDCLTSFCKLSFFSEADCKERLGAANSSLCMPSVGAETQNCVFQQLLANMRYSWL